MIQNYNFIDLNSYLLLKIDKTKLNYFLILEIRKIIRDLFIEIIKKL